MNNDEKTVPTHDEKLAKLRDLVKQIDFCMLTTTDENGDLHSRPMSLNGEVEFNGDLWFFTYGSSHKAHEIEREHRVNVSFSQPKSQTYVSLSGKAEIVRDKSKIEELWQAPLKAWFPNGTETEDIALLKVNVEKAEYWDSPSSAVAHAIGFAKALVTHEAIQVGENGQVELK